MDTNYFVCTLGQAAELKQDLKYKNINELVDLQAKRVGDQPAVGFLRPPEDKSQPWEHHIVTFGDIKHGSEVVAENLLENGTAEGTETVALLAPSSPEFLFIWLALMRLGHPVLLIAPQCQPSAIAHLCRTCGVHSIFFDEQYAELAHDSIKELDGNQDITNNNGNITSKAICINDICGPDVFKTIQGSPTKSRSLPEVESKDVAYLHHTSGTSTGLPKPIPQSHRAGAGVLPHFPEGAHRATFTTTPLYHGGIADLFRAWTSDALIWLFPGKELPITAANVNNCLSIASSCSKERKTPPVSYFSSVPYVLQMLEADEQGLIWLQNMDIVGVGGAALPTEVGDRLVRNGVNLISRFGSAECGFLMSSHREYSKDKAWQYLRSGAGSKTLKFEKQEDGTSELVILPGWPHMAKTNREDGSFATADLFESHPSIPNAWKYHSRADAQLTLITGKKFDPAPLEAVIAAAPELSDALIFGNGKPFPGVLLFRSESAKAIDDEELVKIIWSNIEKLNKESQSHAKIPKRMLVPMSYQSTNLEKSSKGTILRNKAEERYADIIESAYSGNGSSTAVAVADKDVAAFLLDTVESITSKPAKVNQDTELFSYGVDSVAGIQIRYTLQRLLPTDAKDLPLNVVEDCGTVRRLAEFVVKRRRGEITADVDDEAELMKDLVEEYSVFKDTMPSKDQSSSSGPSGEIVVLTGATGALGAHILALCRASDRVSKIYCLVRGTDLKASRERIQRSLVQRALPELTENDSKVEVLQTQLGDSTLGLDEEMYNKLAREATVIMHVAWEVNFRLRLRSFAKDSIGGVQNLINLALLSPNREPPRFLFCSSVASAMSSITSPIPERVLNDPASASPLGYSRSKWVAEHICSRAHDTTCLRGRIAAFRVGQLAGDTQLGIWNAKEAYPMMLSTVKLTGSLPRLENEVLNWLPVDLAAQAFMEAAMNMGGSSEEEMRVYHVLNEYTTPQWTDLLGWLSKREKFDSVSPVEWIEKLEALQESHPENSAMKLLGHWKKAYCGGSGEKEEKAALQWEMRGTKSVAPVLKDVKPVDEEYFVKIWNWLKKNI